jgi:hypothetical protein
VACKLLTGFEVGESPTSQASGSREPPGNVFGSGTVANVTSPVRSGTGAGRCRVTGSGDRAYFRLLLGVTSSTTQYVRFYFQVDALPNALVPIFATQALSSPSNPDYSVRLSTTGTLALYQGGSLVGSASIAYAVNTWIRVELQVTYNASTQITAVALRVEGVDLGSFSGATITNTDYDIGWMVDSILTSTYNFYVDDIRVNDSSGAANTSWCGPGRVVLLVPTSDLSVTASTWSKNGATNAVNLFSSVDNIPPVGVADASTGTTTAENQIRDPVSNATADYDANMTTYAAAGVSPAATVNAVQWLMYHGTASTTNTPGRSGQLVSNPAEAGLTAMTVPTSVAATYPTGWFCDRGPMNDAPTVTVANAPDLKVRKTTASTRIVDVCFMGIYVDYTPRSLVAGSARRVRSHLLAR